MIIELRRIIFLKKVVTNIDVRYQETDQMGVVYHANYLIWFEIGRTVFLDEFGIDYIGMEEQHIVSPVIDAQISFKKPIRYGEKVTIDTWLEKYDGLRTVYGYSIKNGAKELAVSGTTEHVIVMRDTFRPLSIRKTFPEWHRIYTAQLEGDK